MLLGIFTIACIVETTLVSVQVWRHVPSHFNFDTPTDTTIAFTLAAGGAVLILCGLGFTALAVRGAAAPPTLLALRASFVALLLAFGVGAVMVARGVRLARSGSSQLAYTTAGHLKPLHAVLLHGVLILLPVALLVEHLDLNIRKQMLAVRTSIAVYAILVGATAASIT